MSICVSLMLYMKIHPAYIFNVIYINVPCPVCNVLHLVWRWRTERPQGPRGFRLEAWLTSKVSISWDEIESKKEAYKLYFLERWNVTYLGVRTWQGVIVVTSEKESLFPLVFFFTWLTCKWKITNISTYLLINLIVHLYTVTSYTIHILNICKYLTLMCLNVLRDCVFSSNMIICPILFIQR